MKLTNHLNLPQPLVEAVRRDSYTKGEADFSVTGLLRPPRISALEKMHEDVVEEDVSEHIYRLLGQTMANVLERAGVPERRFVMDVTVDGKRYTVSGKPDRFFNGILQDWKLTTAWKAKGAVCPDEFIQQLNLYAELMRANGLDVKRLEAILILRDWSKLEMFRNEEYPRKQVAVLSAPVWSREQAQNLLRERIRLHLNAKKQLPECSRDERWAKDDVYAVMKKGRKSAVRLLNNKEAAETFIEEQRLDSRIHHVEKRLGESTRCKFYCPVSQFCEQYQKTATKPMKQPAAVSVPQQQPQKPKPFPNGISFPKRCQTCSKPATNLAQTRCRDHYAQLDPDKCPYCATNKVQNKWGRLYCHPCWMSQKNAKKDGR